MSDAPAPRPRRKRLLIAVGIGVGFLVAVVLLPMACRAPGDATGQMYEAIIRQGGVRPNQRVSSAQLLWTDDWSANLEVLVREGVFAPPPLTGQVSPGAAEYLAARDLPVLGAKEGEAFEGQIGWGFNGTIWTFSEPVIAPSGRAIVKCELYCGSLCAGGSIEVLEKTGGVWQVVDSRTLWQS